MRTMFEDTIERFFAEKISPEFLCKYDDGSWAGELWSEMEELGFNAAAAPEALGGFGVSWGDLFPIIRALGHYSVPLPLGETIFTNWLLGQLGEAPREGPLTFSAHSDLTLKNGVISGTITDVPWARHLKYVMAVTSDEVPTCVLLDMEQASNISHKFNVAKEARDDLTFDAIEADFAKQIPAHMTRDILSLGGAMLRSAQIAGSVKRALDLTATYTTERVQFGRPIMKFQAIQQQMAVMAEQVASMQIAAEAAFCSSGDALAALPIMTAKVCAGDAIDACTSIAHGVHGAIGFTHEHSLHFTTRRLWSWRNEFGSQTFWAQEIGRRICKNGGAGLWPTLVSASL